MKLSKTRLALAGGAILLAAAAYLYLGGPGTPSPPAREERAAAPVLYVRGDRVNVRLRPDSSAEVLFQAGEGWPARILERKGGWARVHIPRPDAGSGWIWAKLLGPEPPKKP